MLSKTIFAAAILLLTACNNEPKSSGSTEPTIPKSTATDHAAEIEKLNNQSKECIRLMNSMEETQKVALDKGDTTAAAACRKTIDSAALENAKIGQQLMELK